MGMGEGGGGGPNKKNPKKWVCVYVNRTRDLRTGSTARYHSTTGQADGMRTV